jgi:hypothetical protein
MVAHVHNQIKAAVAQQIHVIDGVNSHIAKDAQDKRFGHVASGKGERIGPHRSVSARGHAVVVGGGGQQATEGHKVEGVLPGGPHLRPKVCCARDVGCAGQGGGGAHLRHCRCGRVGVHGNKGHCHAARVAVHKLQVDLLRDAPQRVQAVAPVLLDGRACVLAVAPAWAGLARIIGGHGAGVASLGRRRQVAELGVHCALIPCVTIRGKVRPPGTAQGALCGRARALGRHENIIHSQHRPRKKENTQHFAHTRVATNPQAQRLV